MFKTATDILIFIVALGLVIFLHELGHFLSSKLFKVPVEEFGFGLPPKLFKLFTLGGTDFTINALPFGAFVRPKGENDPTVPGGLASSSPWVRLVVLLGGPVMNLLTGIFLFTLVFTRSGLPDESTVKIMEVMPATPAAQSGLLADDIVKQINGLAVTDMNMLIAQVKANAGKEITLTVSRGGQTVDIQATPRLNPPPNEGSLGVVLGNPLVASPGWLRTIPYAIKTAYNQIAQLFALPGQLISGAIQPKDARMVGPVGMFQIFQATDNRLALMAVVSVALGITNLLPIPALDGGRILFVLPEIVLRKRIPVRYENTVNMVGMLLLLALMFYITAQDLINPIIGQ